MRQVYTSGPTEARRGSRHMDRAADGTETTHPHVEGRFKASDVMRDLFHAVLIVGLAAAAAFGIARAIT